MKIEFKTDKSKLLDLFCGGGGCAKGYVDAGFEVVGVDIKNRNYPFAFIQADVMELINDEEFVSQFNAIHASPPCQMYTQLKHLSGDLGKWEEDHVDLIAPVREKLKYYEKKYGIIWIMENVRNAPLINPITLKGSQFKNMFTQRPRLFESCIDLYEPDEQPRNMGTSRLGTISETGAVSICGNKPLQGLNEEQTKLYYMIALGGECTWMDLEELTQCVPPAYTRFLGKQLLDYLNKSEKKERITKEQIMQILTSKEFLELVKKYIA